MYTEGKGKRGSGHCPYVRHPSFSNAEKGVKWLLDNSISIIMR